MVRDILKLGDSRLYSSSSKIQPREAAEAARIGDDLKDTMEAFRTRHGFGRAIAAPQIGEFRRVIYMDAGKPALLVNPVLTFIGEDTMEVWDDCMCFPGLFVKVRRFAKVQVQYLDENMQRRSMLLETDLSELIQHECDHLDGILATMRAVDARSFSLTKNPVLEQGVCK